MTLRIAKKIFLGRSCGGVNCHSWQQITQSATKVERAARRGSRLVSAKMVADLAAKMKDMDDEATQAAGELIKKRFTEALKKYMETLPTFSLTSTIDSE